MTKYMMIGALLATTALAQEQPPVRIQIEDGKERSVDMAVGQAFTVLNGQLLGGKPVKGQPYSAEAVTEMTQTLADGNHIVNRTSAMIYRDSEGRERREEAIARLGTLTVGGAPATMVFISDPVAKVSYSLNPKDHTARKLPVLPALRGGVMQAGIQSYSLLDGDSSGVRVERRLITPGGSASPANSEDLGTQTIEGVLAQGTRTTVTIPAGQIGNDREIKILSERWYSPELQVVIMSKRSDPRIGDTVYKLTNINRTEPQHSLFEVPADYTISTEPEVFVRKAKE